MAHERDGVYRRPQRLGIHKPRIPASPAGIPRRNLRCQAGSPGWDTPQIPVSALIYENGLAEIEGCYLAEGPAGALRSQMMEPMRIVRMLEAVSIDDIGGNRYVFDFGQYIAGFCICGFPGRSGDTRCDPARELVHAGRTLTTRAIAAAVNSIRTRYRYLYPSG